MISNSTPASDPPPASGLSDHPPATDPPPASNAPPASDSPSSKDPPPARGQEFKLPIEAIKEGQVEADVGVMTDVASTNVAAQPLYSPSLTPHRKHSPVEIDYTALGPEHGKLVKLLEDRGAVKGLIDNSTGVEIKRLMLAGVLHDEPDKIISFLLSEAES